MAEISAQWSLLICMQEFRTLSQQKKKNELLMILFSHNLELWSLSLYNKTIKPFPLVTLSSQDLKITNLESITESLIMILCSNVGSAGVYWSVLLKPFCIAITVNDHISVSFKKPEGQTPTQQNFDSVYQKSKKSGLTLKVSTAYESWCHWEVFDSTPAELWNQS